MDKPLINVYVLLIGSAKYYTKLWAGLAERKHLTEIFGCQAFIRKTEDDTIIIAFDEQQDKYPAFEILLAYLQQLKPGAHITISAHRQHDYPKVYDEIRLGEGRKLKIGDQWPTLGRAIEALSSGELPLSTVVSALEELRTEEPQSMRRIENNER